MPVPTARHAMAAGVLAAALLAPASASAAGPPAAAFVPADFRVEQRLRAQLTADARPDAVLVLVRRGRASPPGEPARPRARRLLLLVARADGGFGRIGEGRRILLCTRCGGALFGVARTPVTVRARAGLVIVEQERGSRSVTFQRLRVRVERGGGTRLVGVDVRTRDRLTGARVETSTDLLAGERIVVRVDARGRREERRLRVPVRVIPLERVRHTAFR